jgi:hypothetical protein
MNKIFYLDGKWFGFIKPKFIDEMHHVEMLLNQQAYATAKAGALPILNNDIIIWHFRVFEDIVENHDYDWPGDMHKGAEFEGYILSLPNSAHGYTEGSESKMKTAKDFLREKGIIKAGHSKWICRFEDGSELDIGDLIKEYSDQQLAAFKEKLKNALISKGFKGDDYNIRILYETIDKL